MKKILSLILCLFGMFLLVGCDAIEQIKYGDEEQYKVYQLAKQSGYTGTYEELFTFENLYNAHLKVRLSKRYKKEVIEFELNTGSNIMKLYNELKYHIEKFYRNTKFLSRAYI